MNRLTLEGRFETPQGLRYTPAGVPVLQFSVSHSSLQEEAGQERQVECQVAAVVLGEAASRLARLSPGQTLRVSGFLCRKSRQSAQLVLHVNQYELL